MAKSTESVGTTFASKGGSLMSGMFDGTYTDPSEVDLSLISFKYTCTNVPNTNPPVKRHEWKVNVTVPGKDEESAEQKTLGFCLKDPVKVSGLGFKSKDPSLMEKIERDKTLADRIEKGEKIEGIEDVGVSAACFLDMDKPSHAAFFKFGEALTAKLRDFIKKNPEKQLTLKAHEIDIQNPVHISKATGKHYFALRVSASHQNKE